MEERIYVDWDGQKVMLTWMPMKNMINFDLVTSVHGYCFHEGKVLLVHVKNRGFNVPGGHLEKGENPEDALHREVWEEGYVKGKVQYIGSIEVSHEENEMFDHNGKYPLRGYQMFYKMDITDCLPFERQHETTSRIWVEPEEIPYIMNDHELSKYILEAALKTTI